MPHTANKSSIIENRIKSVFVHVTDLRRAAGWYSQLLGLSIDEEKLQGGPAYWFDLPGTDLILDNNVNNRQHAGWHEAMKPQMMLPCRDIDDAYAHVQRLGGKPFFEPERHPSMSLFTFRAPDGRVYMISQSPRNEALQEEEQITASPVRPVIGGVFLNVREMRWAAQWISELLEVPYREADIGESIYDVPTSGGAGILLDDNRMRNNEAFEIPFMFACDDIEAAFRYANEQGMDVFQGIAGAGVRFFTLRDPDGNLVMVCQNGEQAIGTIEGYALVRLPVRNIQLAAAFYTDMLGFVRVHPEQQTDEQVLLRLRSGDGPLLHLLKVAEEEFLTSHWAQNGLPVHGLELVSGDVQALYRRLVRAGTRIESKPYSEEAHGSYLTFYDPEGHFICVNQPNP